MADLGGEPYITILAVLCGPGYFCSMFCCMRYSIEHHSAAPSVLPLMCPTLINFLRVYLLLCTPGRVPVPQPLSRRKGVADTGAVCTLCLFPPC